MESENIELNEAEFNEAELEKTIVNFLKQHANVHEINNKVMYIRCENTRKIQKEIEKSFNEKMFEKMQKEMYEIHKTLNYMLTKENPNSTFSLQVNRKENENYVWEFLEVDRTEAEERYGWTVMKINRGE